MKAAAQIRRATRADIPVVLELIHALAVYEKLDHLVRADEALLAEELFSGKGPAETLLCMVEGAAAGFAVYFHNFSTFMGRKGLYLEDLFVRPEHRGRGYGKALFLHVARIAHERGCGRFEWMVLDWNTPSIRFYESLGAQRMEDWRLFRVTGDALAALASETG
jgi:GNAT superfamily N-acetyltransferase